MTSGGNKFNDFPAIVPTKLEKTFLVFSSVAVGLFLEWACSISSTQLNPALSNSVDAECGTSDQQLTPMSTFDWRAV